MIAFLESDEYDPKNFVETEFGFALAQEKMPHRKDVFWKKLPEGHVYYFDGGTWFGFTEKPILPKDFLKHG